MEKDCVSGRRNKMVPRGLEPRTLRLLAVRSDQLSYETLALLWNLSPNTLTRSHANGGLTETNWQSVCRNHEETSASVV